jgi:hypothetical protein
MLKWFPLLILAVLFYNLLVFSGELFVSGGESIDTVVNSPMFTVQLFSNGAWRFTWGDFAIFLALVCLFIETIKATDTSSISVVNHGLSTGVFILALIEFLILKEFATSTFFFILVMTLMDVVAGFTISIVAAKRDLGTSHGLIGTN